MASGQLTSRWVAYTRERYPVAVYLLLSTGYVLTGWAAVKTPLSWPPLLLGVLCYMVFFFTLRLMDELKDFQKDVLAHPERPLPRGLLSPNEARIGMLTSTAAMFLLSAIAGAMISPQCGFLFAFSSFYLWLMYKEFYIGSRLADFPLVYAISHQIISIPLVLFSAQLFAADALQSLRVYPAALLILGAFFTYEVCRKLDPQAHPILKTYLGVYGRPRTVLIVVGSSLVAALGAFKLDVPLLFWVSGFAVLVSFALPKERYKLTETLATLSLTVHVLGLPILRAMGVFQP